MSRSTDKMFLAAALALLAALAIILGILYPGRNRVVQNGSGQDANKNISPLDTTALTGTLDAWNRLPSWQFSSGEGDLFMAEKYMMYPGGEVTPVDVNTQIDGLPLAWLLQYNLDFRAGNIANEDTDGNGFSNRQKYLAHCNPRDPKSHPLYITRLRLRAVDSVSFKVTFQSHNKLQGAYVFSINLPMAATKQNRLVRRGENVEGFVVTDFRMKKEGDADNAPDHSELDFEKPNSGIKITALLGKPTEFITTFARFSLFIPGQIDRDIRVEVGKTFELSLEPGAKYALVSADNGSAVIRNLQSGQEMTVPRGTPEEEKEVAQIHSPTPARRGSQPSRDSE